MSVARHPLINEIGEHTKEPYIFNANSGVLTQGNILKMRRYIYINIVLLLC